MLTVMPFVVSVRVTFVNVAVITTATWPVGQKSGGSAGRTISAVTFPFASA